MEVEKAGNVILDIWKWWRGHVFLSHIYWATSIDILSTSCRSWSRTWWSEPGQELERPWVFFFPAWTVSWPRNRSKRSLVTAAIARYMEPPRDGDEPRTRGCSCLDVHEGKGLLLPSASQTCLADVSWEMHCSIWHIYLSLSVNPLWCICPILSIYQSMHPSIASMEKKNHPSK